MYCYPNNAHPHTDKRAAIEMALQIIAGVRDPWTLTDEECETLNFVIALRSDDFRDELRRTPGCAKKAACALVADVLTPNDD